MNHSLQPPPLVHSSQTQARMQQWMTAQQRGDNCELDVYGKPSEKQLQELENVRSLSKELQDNLTELESSVRIPEVENQALNPTAPILDYSEHHEFVSVKTELVDDAAKREEEKMRLMKDGRISLKASRVVEKVIL